MSLKQKRYSKIFITTVMVAALAAGALTAAWSTLTQHKVDAEKVAAYEAAVSVVTLSPADDAHVTKNLTVQFYTEGLQASQYEPFWSVDNGKWNRMTFAQDNPQLATQQIDISNWNWHKDGNYTVTLTALIKGSWKPIQATVTIHVDSPAAVVAAPPATAASKAAGAAPAAASPAAPKTISASQSLYVDAQGDTYRNATAAANADPANAARFNKLANTPVSNWYGDWSSNLQADVSRYVGAAAAVGQIPSLVAYNIPQRDCGSYSAGGANSGNAYLNWIRSFAAGIGQRPAIVILEPDALAAMDCLSAADQASRTALLSQAVTILRDTTGAQIYLDAGNPGWQRSSVMAKRLADANVAQANGFALNVSNFFTTSDNKYYGDQLSAAIGGKHYVVDTSRNGNGPTPDHAWCNPAGRAVGQAPTLQTGSSLADAYLWVKGPGGSDGSCVVGGVQYPAAGVWWASIALDLLR